LATLAVPRAALRELERLAARGVPHGRAALAFAARLPSVDGSGVGDAAVLDAARRRGAMVVTADRALARRVRAEGLAVLGPRDRSRLELRPPAPVRSAPAPRRAARRPKG